MELRAIYSRSKASAEKLSNTLSFDVDIYHESPNESGHSFDEVLRRNDIQAVVCCLPILTQLDFVKRCVLAGKHVQSEKPIAGDVSTAAAFINWFRQAQREGIIGANIIWAVAEEFRLMPAIQYARESIRELGQIVVFAAQGYLLIGPGNPFFDTSWRKVPGYQGGFLLDGGVHWTAALLHLLYNEKIVRVSAFSTLLQPHLAPVDTLHAIVQLQTGVSGTFGYSAGIAHKQGSGLDFEVVCEHGRVVIERASNSIKVTVTARGGDAVQEFDSSLNTRYEITTFIQSIQNNCEESGETPEAALLDLLILQSMLESGEAHGQPREVDIKQYLQQT